MALDTPTRARPAHTAAQPAIPRSNNRINSTNPGQAGNQSNKNPSTTPPTSPPAHIANRYHHRRRSSSARPASAQVTLSSNTVCAPRGRSPASPRTPPRAPFRRSPKGNQASPPMTVDELTVSPPASSASNAAPTSANNTNNTNDENVAPAGAARDSPPPRIPLRRKFKERRELEGHDEIYWENEMPPVQKAAKHRPKKWENVSYYQAVEWDTDDEEYPEYVRPPRPEEDPKAEQPVPNMYYLSHPSEGDMLKLEKDKKLGQFWVGVKGLLGVKAAGRRSQTLVSKAKLPGHASEEDQNQNPKDIDPVTGLPTGDWVEERVDDIVAQTDGAAKELDKLRGELASLFGEIMIEKIEIDEEGLQHGEFWCTLLDSVDENFLAPVGDTIIRAMKTGVFDRITEPFVNGEPKDLSSSSRRSKAGGRDNKVDGHVTDGVSPRKLYTEGEDLTDEEIQRAVDAAKKAWWAAHVATLPPGAGHSMNANRLVQRKGRKARKPPHTFIPPGPSPLSGKKKEKKMDEAVIDEQNSAPPIASGSKQKEVAPETAVVPSQTLDVVATPSSPPKQNKDAAETTLVLKKDTTAPKIAIVPKQKAVKAKIREVVIASEEQYWEDNYVEEDDTSNPFQYKSYTQPSQGKDEESAAEEAIAEGQGDEPPKDSPPEPKNPSKRSRDSDDEESEGDSDDEIQVSQALKKRKISGSYGASDEDTPVNSASQAEYDRKRIDETDERSSSDEQSSSEDGADDDDSQMEEGEVAEGEDESEEEEEGEGESLIDDEAERKAALEHMMWLRQTSEEI